jgi:hypothetical protein
MSALTFQRSATVEAADLDGEVILFAPGANRFFVLNRTASFIWERLEAPSTVEDIASGLCRSFTGVALSDAVRDVESAVREMLSSELVVAL